MKRLYSALLLSAAAITTPILSAGEITLKQGAQKVDVHIDGQHFTSFHFKNVPKPVLYPVMWTDGKTSLTRRYPMEKALPGESNDHVHHRSLWWGHRHVKAVKSGSVTDFWGEGSNSGKQVTTKVEAGKDTIKASNKWVTKTGEVVATDSRTIRFLAPKAGRMLDYTITIHASEGDIVLQDDKDAGMSIRVPDSMCVSPHGTAKLKAKGNMLNSEGVKDAACWGKRAKWVDYYGTVNGKTLGVAIFDHPGNPRHPSSWHARAYGLCAANVFGKRHFERLKDRTAGDMTLKKGQSVTFRYRFVWHEGPANAKKIEALYGAWTAAAGQ